MRPPPPAMPQYPHQMPQPGAYGYGLPPPGAFPAPLGAFPPRPPMAFPPPGAPRPPPPGQGGPPPPPSAGGLPPPPSGPEPEAKRARTDFVLQLEEEFLDAHPGQSKVRRAAYSVS